MKSAIATTLVSLAAAADDKIKVELYYESQCPACRDTIVNSFKHAYAAEGFTDMAEVTFIPYGNASEKQVGSSWTYQCQHGETECQFNYIESCGISLITDPVNQFNFIECIEESDNSRAAGQDYDTIVDGCAEVAKSTAQAAAIKACRTSSTGNSLEHAMAVKTAALSPAHTYVPWIVAGGVHNDDVQNQIQGSLLSYVCGKYTGPNKSADC